MAADKYDPFSTGDGTTLPKASALLNTQLSTAPVNFSAGGQPVANPNKVIHLTFSGKDWKTAFGPDLIAPGIVLTLNEEVKVTAESKYGNVLGDMVEKFKNSTPGKAMAAIQKLSSAAAGVQSALDASKSTSAAPEDNAKNRGGLLSKMQVLPPNSRYQTTLSNIPAWQDTEPLHFSEFTFKFFLGMAGAWDGRTEVYNPVIALSTVNLPYPIDGTGRLEGPLPSYSFVYAKLGTDIVSAVTNAAVAAYSNPENTSGGSAVADNLFEKALDDAANGFGKRLWKMLDEGYPGIIVASVGTRLKLPPFIVASTSYKFSQDTDDKGFPIWGEVTWGGIQTLEVANKSMPAYKLYGKE
jgi:hypothetical protein